VVLALIKTLRPRQWVKNAFVAAPLFFALRMTDGEAVARTAAAVLLFSLISGTVYVLNDLVDVEADRQHPKKMHRPIPSGALPMGVARVFVIVAVPLLLAGALAIDWRFSAALAAYFVLNVAYSFRLKHVAYLDVTMIAGFFLLRVFAGAFAIDVAASPWLLACTFLLALFLGFGKRAHELAGAQTGGQTEGQTRAALRQYHLPTLRWIMHALAVITVVAYVLYTRDAHTVQTFGTEALVYTAPFPIIGILRFIHLTVSRADAESPTEEMLRDPLFMGNLLLWVATTAAILYGT
jgi:4-hydroxybenzoate polyprenyltransferase